MLLNIYTKTPIRRKESKNMLKRGMGKLGRRKILRDHWVDTERGLNFP